MPKTKKCAMCDSKVKMYPLCQDCLYETGKDYTAANFDLSGLSLVERQLVFLWACGQDISQYFDKHLPLVSDDEYDITDPLYGKKTPGFLTSQVFGKDN